MQFLRQFATGLSMAALVIVTTTAGSLVGARGPAPMLQTERIAPVTAPYTGAANAIRGVSGGGLPWVITRGEITVSTAGNVHARVRGLVIDPAVPNPAVAGINPIGRFKVTISCLSIDVNGAAITVNVSTRAMPATPTGDAEIEDLVAMPSRCLAPIAFITNGLATGNGAWFATTGR
jgi:hypothetical protein